MTGGGHLLSGAVAAGGWAPLAPTVRLHSCQRTRCRAPPTSTPARRRRPPAKAVAPTAGWPTADTATPVAAARPRACARTTAIPPAHNDSPAADGGRQRRYPGMHVGSCSHSGKERMPPAMVTDSANPPPPPPAIAPQAGRPLFHRLSGHRASSRLGSSRVGSFSALSLPHQPQLPPPPLPGRVWPSRKPTRGKDRQARAHV